MANFCKTKYRLELHWEKVTYHNDRIALLHGAYFSGPVLKNTEKINAPDFIDLDLTPQLIKVFDSYYIVRLDWSGVQYKKDGSIELKEARLTNDYLRTLHKIEEGDYVQINTEKHEEKTHAYHLVYESTVIRKNKEKGKFK